MKSRFAEVSLSMAGFAMTVLLIADGVTAQTANALRWKFAKDDQFDVQLVQDTKISSQIDRRGQQMTNQMTLDMDWSIQSVNDDRTAVIQQTIRRIQLTITTPTDVGSQSVSIDTDDSVKHKDLAKRLLEQVSPLIGTLYTVNMSHRGEVLNVDIPKSSMDALRGAPASMQLRKVLTKEGVKEMFGQSAIVFPEQKISVGDAWKSDEEIVNALGTFTKSHTYTYDGPQQKGQKPLQHFTIETDLKQKEANKQGSQVLEFKGGGELWMDDVAGYVTESLLTNEMKTVNKTYPSSIINTTITSNVSVKVTKK